MRFRDHAVEHLAPRVANNFLIRTTSDIDHRVNRVRNLDHGFDQHRIVERADRLRRNLRSDEIDQRLVWHADTLRQYHC
ncbi:hypothetical protein WK61_00390 [Burkholderia ubonensis]|nr:hypothetical protein WK61_00390 [Burkholderia ubonensis]